MNSLTLDFDGEPRRSGFRLYRLEVWNWGTFHDQVWTIEPSGYTSLLTGANGSGKSTLVDGLLTLLVPNQKRNYNQASGAGRKRERSELTYVRGAYGKVQSEDGYASKTQYLRGKDDYSVLLGYFYNEGYQQAITLAQVFCLKNGAVDKFFVVAQSELEVARHFRDFKSIRELKARLKKMPKVRVYDKFVQYSKSFRKLLGLRSEKALDLFNQTVTIKEIGSLNNFVRTHMLEKSDAQSKVDQLQEHFEDLSRAHDAMMKAQRQLEQLEPMLRDAAKFEQLAVQIGQLEACELVIPAYFAGKKMVLLQEAMQEAQQGFAQEENSFKAIEEQLERWRQQEKEWYSALNSDEIGLQIKELEREMARLQKQLASKKEQEQEYSRLAQRLSLPLYGDQESFYASRGKAQTYDPHIDRRLKELQERRDEHKITLRQLRERYNELNSELNSLKQRQSQIPHRNLSIRRQILSDLAISEAQMPFIGELLKVKDRERAWEGATERLLHSFGLCMLVPEEEYRRVNHYVNQTNLRGRLVFYRVKETSRRPVTPHLDKDALAYKLQIKPGTAFYAWLESELTSRFTHVCCDTLERFQRERRAITKNGLIKSGEARHEKDDRRALNDRKNYILGWNNADKIKAIEAEAAAVSKEMRAENEAVKEIEKQTKQREQQRLLLRDFLRFDDFAQIDWQADAAQIRALDEQKRRLEASSDHLRQLQEELEAAARQIRQLEGERSATQKKLNRLEWQISQYETQYKSGETLFKTVPSSQMEAHLSRIQEGLSEAITLDNVARLQKEAQQRQREATEKQKNRQRRLEKRIEKAMVQYKHDYQAETTDIDASIEAIGEFERLLAQIKRDDLPRYAAQFKELLDRRIIENIAFLKSELDKYVEEIEEKVRHLNVALCTIPYTPSTFIQLNSEPTRDAEIRAFQSALKACLPDVGQPESAESNEASFQKIKALLQRLRDDTRWTRKVTDVRQWLNFSASERYKEDNSEKHYYSDSSGKSGGQKAKLAYTILASAIAYQYGLEVNETRSKSFRFVVVDEAFSRSDEKNASYAMTLFGKLSLQLLIITPAKDIHVVEPFISACHYVFNNEQGNHSQVHNMNMTQYYAQKAVFEDM
ncbi:MAG: ATP-binding protein [Ardenticatenaceae bacterium]